MLNLQLYFEAVFESTTRCSKENVGKPDLFGDYLVVWTSSAAAPETAQCVEAGRSRKHRKEVNLGADRRRLCPVEDPLGAVELIV